MKGRMKALVTGGAGFIGSHCVDGLLSNGHRVTILDNFSTGRRENLAHLHDNPDVRIHVVDIAGEGDLGRYFDGVDWVFHFAGLADIVPSIQKPKEYHHANVDGTVNVLEAARAAGVAQFVYAASSSCYGIPSAFPTPESAPIQPQYPYAMTKYLGELYTLHWGGVYKFPAVSLRFFNVYGPRSRTSGTYGAVFGVFLAQKLNRRPFTVVGDGRQTRDFVYVTDVVNACLMAAEAGLVNESLNVGSGKTYSVHRLVELLGGEVEYVPKRPGEPDCTHADISRIRRLLGWEPRVTFEEGVRRLLESIECWRNSPLWTKETIAQATKEWFQYLSP